MRNFNRFAKVKSVYRLTLVLVLASSTLGFSASKIFASSLDRAEETLNQIAEAGNYASNKFELDAKFRYQDLSCLPLGDSKSVCSATNVFGIGVNLLLDGQALMLIQLVVSPTNVRDEKSIGRAINAFVAFSVSPKEQRDFDFYALAFAACVLRKAASERIIQVEPIKLTSTGSGCVADFEP